MSRKLQKRQGLALGLRSPTPSALYSAQHKQLVARLERLRPGSAAFRAVLRELLRLTDKLR